MKTTSFLEKFIKIVMKSIKSVLVPIDFSSNSIEALKYASLIALKNKCTIKLLNVIESNQFSLTFPDYGYSAPYIISTQGEMLSKLKNNNERHLKKLAGTRELKSIPVQVKVIAGGSVYYDIVEYAEKTGAGMIIMGTKGTTSIKKIFLGSTAERVIRLTSKPVLAIGGKAGKKKISKIVFASDFTREAYTAYPVINTIIKSFNAYIHLLKINSRDGFQSYDKILKDINRFTKRFSGKFIPKVRASSEIDEGIAGYAKIVKADMIVLGVHRKKAIRRLLGNRILEGILRLTNIPVLAVDIP